MNQEETVVGISVWETASLGRRESEHADLGRLPGGVIPANRQTPETLLQVEIRVPTSGAWLLPHSPPLADCNFRRKFLLMMKYFKII